ncbi:hypothetical protein CI109_104899 [Kwoniella shandongensis]|uniref:Golgi apparatus membrane protein tvp38 n=1 Tax=Kwoniella shandongensis TaxID=1734106 RepID=A0AAJ8MYI4_9TREE
MPPSTPGTSGSSTWKTVMSTSPVQSGLFEGLVSLIKFVLPSFNTSVLTHDLSPSSSLTVYTPPLLCPNPFVASTTHRHVSLWFGTITSSTQPSAASSSAASSSSPITTPTPSNRPRRLMRSRTSTFTSNYTPPLAPVMSRENSEEDLHHTTTSDRRPMGDAADVVAQLSQSLQAGPSRMQGLQQPTHPTRRASKSISGSRPSLLTPSTKRTQSYYTPQIKPQATLPLPPSPVSPEVDTSNMLKRRTSTPAIYRRFTVSEEKKEDEPQSELLSTNGKGKGKAVESRARSTSTSVVIPQDSQLTENSTYTFPPRPIPQSAPLRSTPSFQQSSIEIRQEPWNGMVVTPASPDLLAEPDLKPSSMLTSAYNVGESSILRLVNWARPRRHQQYVSLRRGSDEDSEKGLNGSDEDETSDTRDSEESLRKGGKYWGIWGSAGDPEEEANNYFSLPSTPPEDRGYTEYELALDSDGSFPTSLPTPALSTKSLSRGNSKRDKIRRALRRSAAREDSQNGWLSTVVNLWSGSGSGKTGEVLRELGWTVGALVITFFVSAALVLWLIQGMPITTLKHFPQSTTDLQLLSAEIRSYMAASDYGWWHTIVVLTFVGCWKHAWSVPGAVILNILVGSLLDPMPALALLTIITASGSLGAYSLSRPLAPLIAVLFPKPLALVRAALVPDSVPAPELARQIDGETITPIQASSDPSAETIGGPTEAATVWRRLLIMRAMGFVPWSGMNVACGVVGVDWRTFWLTTAAGSASWSYVTASVGHILARLKVPTAALAAASVTDDASQLHGESLTSLLRDPVLIFKLVFLSALTLIPVILKRRSSPRSSAEPLVAPLANSSYELHEISHPGNPTVSALRLSGIDSSAPPMSPLSQSLAQFTPTPRAFDLLSFGRVAMRQSSRAVFSGLKSAVGSVSRVARSVA